MPAHILVVEDEEPLLGCCATISRGPATGRDHADGDEAEARLKEAVPDLLVLDWMLPGLSGIELCRPRRRRRRRPRVHAALHGRPRDVHPAGIRICGCGCTAGGARMARRPTACPACSRRPCATSTSR